VLDARNNCQRYLAYSEVFVPDDRARLLGDGVDSTVRSSSALAEQVVADAMRPATGLALAQQLAFTDLRLWVGEHFNPRLDRIAMMHSVEARVPFQDDALVDAFVWTDPQQNLANGSGKRLLRAAFAERLPAEVLERRKRPFQAPGAALVRQGLRRLLPELLAARQVERFGGLDSSATDAIIERALGAGQVDSFKIWTLIALQLWCEAFLVPARVAV
jgi:asparagine synthase (glutamine-hydrolysing)